MSGKCPKCCQGELRALNMKALPYAWVWCTHCAYHYYGAPR